MDVIPGVPVVLTQLEVGARKAVSEKCFLWPYLGKI
jgi:hypothetical protein